MPFDVTGKTALITGASSGLGTRFARVLAAHGARVALAARREEALAQLQAEIVASGGEAYVVRMDVTEEASVTDAVSAVDRQFGPIDILVNNAGVGGAKPALEASSDDWESVFNTNLRGAFFVAREVGRTPPLIYRWCRKFKLEPERFRRRE